MPLIDPGTQISKPNNFNDQYQSPTFGQDLQDLQVYLEDTINAILTQIRRIIGSTNWYDDPGTSLSSSVSLDNAYDAGGSGAGRIITVDAGAVRFNAGTGINALEISGIISSIGLNEDVVISPNPSGTGVINLGKNSATPVQTNILGTIRISGGSPTAGKILGCIDSIGNAQWVTAGSGGPLITPLTTAGDLWIRNASNNDARLGIGASGTILTSTGIVPNWSNTLNIQTLNIKDDLFVINSDASGASSDFKFTISRPTSGMIGHVTLYLPTTAGTSGQFLGTSGSGQLDWISLSGSGFPTLADVADNSTTTAMQTYDLDSSTQIRFTDSLNNRILTIDEATRHVSINTTSTADFHFRIAGHIGPDTDNTYDLGSSSLRWRNLYVVNSISIGSFSVGSVLFSGLSGLISGDPINFFWDNTNKRLGIGTNTPVFTITTAGSIGPSVNDTYDLGSSVLRWRDIYLGPSTIHIGSSGNEGTITYDGSNNLVIDSNGNVSLQSVSGNVGIGTLVPAEKLSVNGNVGLDGELKRENAGANASFIIVPKGTGALQIGSSGDARGIYAVDLQSVRTSSDQVASGDYSFIAGGKNNKASGDYSHAEGVGTLASNNESHAEGFYTTASGSASHAEGSATVASGNFGSHAEGYATTASGKGSHAEGFYTTSFGPQSHAEGNTTTADGSASHAEGFYTTSTGINTHAEGYYTTSFGTNSHAEGKNTVSTGNSSHSEGNATDSVGIYSHAEGDGTISTGNASHSEGKLTTSTGVYSHAEGYGSTSGGANSHAEGYYSQSSGSNSHAEGESTVASGINSHAEGSSTSSIGDYSHAEGDSTTSSGNFSHAEGKGTSASDITAHAEGYVTVASGYASHSEGHTTTASGNNSHAEGINSISSGNDSHAEGKSTTSSGTRSHSEGYNTISSETNSHAEGYNTTASGTDTHSEGHKTTASGYGSHSENISSISSSTNSKDTFIIASLTITISGNVTQKYSNGGKITFYDLTGGVNSTLNTAIRTINSTPTFGGVNTTFNIDSVLDDRTAGKCLSASGGSGSHAEGIESVTNSTSSHSEGLKTVVAGHSSHAEGYNVIASGNSSHAEGDSTRSGNRIRTFTVSSTTVTISGDVTSEFSNGSTINIFRLTGGSNNTLNATTRVISAVVFGGVNTTFTINQALDDRTSGQCVNTFIGISSHSEGKSTIARGNYSHAEGKSTTASGYVSHSEGNNTTASGITSHSEGKDTTASGNYSHAEGKSTTASNTYSHAEGGGSVASGVFSHSEGHNTTASGARSHAEGKSTISSGNYSHAEGESTTSGGPNSHSEGKSSTASGNVSHAEGQSTTASGHYSHAEGQSTTASGDRSHAEGRLSSSTGNYSHAEGYNTTALGIASHAEGKLTESNGLYSHAEGESTTASGDYSHAEGSCTTASVLYSHAEGSNTVASGQGSHAEGVACTASGAFGSHAEGFCGHAQLNSQHAQGNAPSSTDLGKRQYTRTILFTDTKNATPTELTLTGSIPAAPASRFTIDTEKAYDFWVRIVARQDTGGAHAEFTRKLLIERTGGTTSQVGLTQTIGTDINSAGWTVTLSANDTNDFLQISVTGAAATNIRWIAVVEAVEVYYAD